MFKQYGALPFHRQPLSHIVPVAIKKLSASELGLTHIYIIIKIVRQQ